MPKSRLFEIEKISEKKVKTQMRPNFLSVVHLISSFKCSKENMDFF
jgi:hypothetical protein